MNPPCPAEVKCRISCSAFSCWDGVPCAKVTGGAWRAAERRRALPASEPGLQSSAAWVALHLQLAVCVARKPSAFGMVLFG